MKKLFFTILLLVMIFAGFANVQAEQLYYNDEYHYYDAGVIGLEVDGVVVGNLPMYPVIINDYTMVPAREVFEAMGSQVIWHDDTCSVEIINNGVSVSIKIGDRNTVIDGNIVSIDEPQPLPMLIGKEPKNLKTMVPVRFVAEKLGFIVEWDNDTRTVSITGKYDTPPVSEDKPTVENPSDEGAEDAENGTIGSVSGETDAYYDYIYVPTTETISPKITRYSDPDRVVFDFPGARFSVKGGGLNVRGNCVDTVRYSNHDEYARLVLDVVDDAQIMLLKDDKGIVIRVEASPNTKLVYDALSQRVHFDKGYAGNGKKTENGYSVTFTNLKLENQTIEINDDLISTIEISNSAKGCTVTVSGSKNLTYTAEKGFFSSETSSENEEPGISISGKPVIVIDAGHGGKDPGAVHYNSAGKITVRESNINLAIALLLGEKLEQSGVEVIYTRKNDTYKTLQERSELSNDTECDLFVSIHCNSIENPEIKGTQVYYHPSSETGTYLAKNIYKNILDTTVLDPGGTRNGAHLYVIRTTTSPAVLVETAFLSNQSDREYLQNKANQEKIAEGIFRGIIQTLDK